MTLQTIVFIVGLVLGVFLIIAVFLRYLKQGSLKFPGMFLVGVGVVLLGLSIWSTIEIEAGGLKIKLKTLTKQVEVIADEVTKMAESTEKARHQLLSLTDQLQEIQAIPEAKLQIIRKALNSEPTVNSERLNMVKQELKSMLKEE